MRRTGLLLACVLLLVTNALVLWGVAYNRRGAPEARVILTERELRLGYGEKENTGMWLRLDSADVERWRSAGPSWLDLKKLEELGFDCSLPVTDASAEIYYDKALPLRRYAVLEFDGDAWKTWIARREEELLRPRPGSYDYGTPEQRRKPLEAERAGHSRLFLIDVGRDAADLRRRYPDRSRHIVTEAVVRLHLHRAWDEGTKAFKDLYLEGSVEEIPISTIHVPLHRRQVLEAVRREQMARVGTNTWDPSGVYAPYLPAPPRYQVTLSYGRRLEPWIDDIRPIVTNPLSGRREGGLARPVPSA